MAFIAGYVSARDRMPTDALAQRVHASPILLGEDPAEHEHTIVATRFGHLLTRARPAHPLPPTATTDNDGNALVALGFLSSGDVLLDPKQVLASCVQDPRALEACQGEFVAIFAESGSGAVHLVNDRFGARPCYVLSDHGGTYFSSNLAFLLSIAGSHPPADVLGWLQVSTMGHTCGARTTFTNISRLMPGTHLTILPGERTERRYWRLAHDPEKGLDPVAHSASVFEAFQRGTALRARLAGPGIVALSGGLDSRLLAGAIPAGAGFSAFTFIDSAAADSTPQSRVATEVARVLGLPHHLERAHAPYSRYADNVVRLTGGLRPLQHAAVVMFYLEEMARRGVSCMLGGGPGDSLAGSAIPSARYVDPGAMTECVTEFCRRRSARIERLGLVLRDDVLRDHADLLFASLLESFDGLTGPTPAHRVTAWKMVHRQPTFTFTSIMHTHPDVVEAFCHLDYRYVDLMLKLPAEWLYQRSFYSLMIHTALASLRHVPYANTGALLSGRLLEVEVTPPHPLRGLTARMARFARRARGVGRWIAPRRSPEGFHSTLFRNDPALVAGIRECLHSYPASREILDVAKCDRYLREFAAGAHPGDEPFGSVATMALAQRVLRP